MKTENFILLLMDNIGLYLLTLLLSFALYYILYRKIYVSIFDPVIFQTIGSMFGFSVVIFLAFVGEIKSFYLLSYITTQGAFWIGFFSFNQKKTFRLETPLVRIKNEMLLLESCFLVLSIFHIMIQLLSYNIVGVPLFAAQRLDIYASGGGIGILGRFISTMSYSAIFLAFSILKFSQKKSMRLCAVLYGFVYIIFSLLSGSRAGFLPVFIIYFLFCSIVKKRYISSQKEVGAIFVLLLSGVLLMFLKADSLESAFGELIVRIIGYGDIYWTAYPNDTITCVDTTKPLQTLFTDVLGTYRIVPWDNLPIPLGRQLYNYMYWDANMGGNARHNVFALAYMGFGFSAIYSYLLGLLLGFIRSKLFFKMRNIGVLGMLYVVVYMNISSIEADAPYVVSLMNSSLITFALFVPLVLLLYKSEIVRQKSYYNE